MCDCFCRLMYWTDAGMPPKIEFSWMDGSKRTILVGQRLGIPTGLTIDYAGGHRIYWCDTKLDTIESMKMDGTDRVTILTSKDIFFLLSLNILV